MTSVVDTALGLAPQRGVGVSGETTRAGALLPATHRAPCRGCWPQLGFFAPVELLQRKLLKGISPFFITAGLSSSTPRVSFVAQR